MIDKCTNACVKIKKKRKKEKKMNEKRMLLCGVVTSETAYEIVPNSYVDVRKGNGFIYFAK